MIRLALLTLTVLASLFGPHEAEAGGRRWRRSPRRCCPPCAQPACGSHGSYGAPCVPVPCQCAPDAQLACLSYYLCPDTDPDFHWYLVDVNDVDENGNCTSLYSDLFRHPDPYLECPEYCRVCTAVNGARARSSAANDSDPGSFPWSDTAKPHNQEPDPMGRRARRAWGDATEILNEDIAFTFPGSAVGRRGDIYVEGYRFEVDPTQVAVGVRGEKRVVAIGHQKNTSPPRYARPAKEVRVLRDNTVLLKHPHYGDVWFVARLNAAN